ncbi:hypothetical protein AV530_007750 [Patagioenas fasciata monilis]|uniref:Uncharacterized protein n=1 Tax=Patagioenas fasciata monilis TaxID=372326 RepID=A0A1V4JZA4_PATFA|nr:hypothetical protein AV530_007750 [Patagioenas fasciata monilis]
MAAPGSHLTVPARPQKKAALRKDGRHGLLTERVILTWQRQKPPPGQPRSLLRGPEADRCWSPSSRRCGEGATAAARGACAGARQSIPETICGRFQDSST